MNTKEVGEISEAQVLAKLLLKGETVLQPFGDNKRYDLVVERDSKFIRVQVKTARLKDNVISFPTCSSYAHRAEVKKVTLEKLMFL